MQRIPTLGLGTFRLKGDQVRESVVTALDIGYRHIDTAQAYNNEAEVGQAVADSGVAREEIFLTTKVWLDNLPRDKFLGSVRSSLEKLRSDYVDLLLIHWPAGEGGPAMAEYLEQLAAAKQGGMARAIGVSNFTNAQLDEAVQLLGKGEVVTNQVEFHPYFQNPKVLERCRHHGVAVTGYMPLAYGKVLEDEVLKAIAEHHGVGVADVVIAWSLARDVVTIPSSTRRAHMQSNFAAQSLQLSGEEIRQIDGLDRGERLVSPDFAPAWDD